MERPAFRRRRASMALDSWSRTSCDPSGREALTFAGRCVLLFLTRQASCAPVAAQARNRAMEKKLRSARFSVPGVNSSTRVSTSSCSLVAYEPTAAARTLRVPHAVSVSTLACGWHPPVGVANHARIASVSARSKMVPSNAVSSNPNSHAPTTGPRSGSAAVARNRAWNTFSSTLARACDNADPVGTPTPGGSGPDSAGTTLARTES